MLRFRALFLGLVALILLPAMQNLPAQQRTDSEPSFPGFSGIWTETPPANGRPMRLKFSQDGSQVTVWLSYSDNFGDTPTGTATISKGVATWAARQGCVQRFRSPGYDYENPGLNTFALSFLQTEGLSEQILVYTQVTKWDAPCGGHPIGTEGVQKVLTRN